MSETELITIYECEICGAVDHSSEGQLTDTGLVCCEKYHYFCPEHINDVSPDALTELIEDANAEGTILDAEAEAMKNLIEVKNFISEFSRRLVEMFLFPSWPEDIPEEICPVCTLRVIPDTVIIHKLLDMVCASRTQIEDLIRLECGTLEEAMEIYHVTEEQEEELGDSCDEETEEESIEVEIDPAFLEEEED